MSVRVNISKIDIQTQDKIAKDLYIKPIVPGARPNAQKQKPDPPFPFFSLDHSTKEIKIPLYYATNTLSLHPSDECAPLRDDFPDPTATLRDGQKYFYNQIVESMEKTGGAVLGVPPGFGKTIMGSLVASEAGYVWAVIVPRKTLIDQWLSTFATCFTGGNLAEAKKRVYIPLTGKDSKKTIIHEEYDAIITMDTRVSGIPPALRKRVGFLIIDEGHMLSTRSRVDPLLSFMPKYVLVETATLHRDDNKDKMMKLLAGDSVISPSYYTSEPVKTLKVAASVAGGGIQPRYDVFIVNTGRMFTENIQDATGKLDFTDLCKQVSADEYTNDLIVKCLIGGVVSEQKRKFIVLTKLANHATALCEKITDPITGDTMTRSKKVYRDSDVLIGTMPKIGTGFDEKTFCGGTFSGKPSDTLILTHTVKKWQSFEQYRGRVMRCSADRVPTVIIFVPANRVFSNHVREIKKWIIQTGGIIKTVTTPPFTPVQEK